MQKNSFHAILKFREEGQPSVVFQILHFYISKVIFRTFWHSLDQVIQLSTRRNVSSWILSTEQVFWEPIQLAKVLLINVWYQMIFFPFISGPRPEKRQLCSTMLMPYWNLRTGRNLHRNPSAPSHRSYWIVYHSSWSYNSTKRLWDKIVA